MSMSATRHIRKAHRPDWVARTSSPKPERPTDRKQRDRARRDRRKASRSYRGGLI